MVKKWSQLPRQSTQGFTLLELLVVILMVGILMAIAAPGWLAFVNNQRLGTARGHIGDVLRAAQADAKRTKVDRVVALRYDNGAPQIAVVPVTKTTTPDYSKANWENVGRGDVQKNMIQVYVRTGATTNLLSVPQTLARFNGYGNLQESATVPVVATVTLASKSQPAQPTGPQRCIGIQTLLGALGEASTEQDCKNL